MNDVYITSAIRTAVGSLGKSLKNVRAEDLGSAVISESITKSNIKPSELDEIIFGQVLTGGCILEHQIIDIFHFSAKNL